MADTKYQQIDEQWVMSRTNRNHGLLPLKTVLSKANNPQDQIHTVHIAGTNGKGSTTNYLKEILMAHGYKVGMFTSPHLITHRDRIRINNNYISEEQFQKYLNYYQQDILAYDLGMFEIDCLIAFTYFKEEHVDIALIETGLGGRLDNTNVIAKPDLEIITTIGYDHMQLLGNRLRQIAFEKAGIIQPNSTCVLGYLDSEVLQVIHRVGMRKQANVISCPKYKSDALQSFIFDGDCYELGTLAQYQKANASLALESAYILGINIHDDLTKQAIKQANWLGRFEVMSKEPYIIIDGAHNEEGIRALVSSLQNLPRPVTILFSALKDKPGRKMATSLKHNCDQLIITQFEGVRADTVADLNVDGCKIIKSWKEALSYSIEQAKEGTLVITGSLYFISIVREELITRFSK